MAGYLITSLLKSYKIGAVESSWGTQNQKLGVRVEEEADLRKAISMSLEEPQTERPPERDTRASVTTVGPARSVREESAEDMRIRRLRNEMATLTVQEPVHMRIEQLRGATATPAVQEPIREQQEIPAPRAQDGEPMG
ncbi:hypothetical protein LTS15_007059 [Exophiala xenobiotica]|nr:hypothetical protein LTS15_007059 [Exophiala xenobiotica]